MKFTFEGWLDNRSKVGKTDPVKSSDDRYEREEGESWEYKVTKEVGREELQSRGRDPREREHFFN